MRLNPTLKKIAEKLNVSISTVSRALKDHPDISPETKRKVNELAKLIEYDPNPYAVNLRTHSSKEFAIVVPSLSNYFYHSFISSIEEDARIYGYSVIIYRSSNDPAIELEILKSCRHKRVSGIFIAITAQTKDMEPFLKLDVQGIPVIFFDKVPNYESCNKICVGDAHAAELAAGEILKKGKKNIMAIFGDRNMSITKTRLERFTACIYDRDPDISLEIIHASSSEETEKKVLKALSTGIKKEFVVFCMSDEILAGAMKAIQRIGVKAPEDLGVIAISDGMIPQIFYPEITYAETSGFKLGKLAFSRMMKCIAGSSFVQTIIDESILVPGGSL
ncbi:LacI family DNA-binding transcriptional regulator [Pedobacter riviphilus]|uniref:LacI family DNA-binding transcriptional regulator n=1 Tax=Pedobacter riviphilus TaxID=2766984 RepID=A0ABX6TKD6_9SPHI|nr:MULTISPECIES: LacI family DNA-binding transcriptional regulator [Pedobacter]NII82140.1 LacI family transcriptional regulator [Pedobacter sp. SG908]NMN36158.1 LacI family transcriptional regulator [Pedobacter sp. SG918]QNR85928.1 LacI family DNA-binding transcriptional regulator [Pedobacter riviphilus]